MNDPHVAALHYRIKHAPDVDFEEAPPVEHSGPGCSVHIENGKAKIVMKCHHSTEKAARDAVEPFLRAWELSWALRHPSDQFEFAFLNGELVDRKPFPPQSDHFVQAELPGVSSAQAGTHHRRAKYPDPPQGLWGDDTVNLMFERYRSVNSQRTTLSDGVYFCLTAMELVGASPTKKRGPTRKGSGAPRDLAATHFQIDLDVLNKVGELATERGGTHARKISGANKPFTPAERTWIEQALKSLIRRAAEVAHDPDPANRSWITMADLPPIP